MLINNNYLEIPEDTTDLFRVTPNLFEENEFINNLMLNPAKYRDFKRNINRINNIDNEINYLKSIEKKNQIDFVSNIKITEEEYNNAVKDAETIFENLNDEQINELLSHKKLLSNERHLLETMVYFLGSENFDWNTFKITFSLYDAKIKMKNIDYSKIKKKKVNILLGQLCRSDKNNNFLNMNDFSDSGLEFAYEWVKCQLKIYFYLFQNNKIPKIKSSKSMVDVYNNHFNYLNGKKKWNMNGYEYKNNTEERPSIFSGFSVVNFSNVFPKNTEQIESLALKHSTNAETLNNNMNSINKINSNNKKINTIQKRSNSLLIKKDNNSSTNGNTNSRLLLTSLPSIIVSKDNNRIEHAEEASFLNYRKMNSIFIPKEAKRINMKIKGINKETEKLYKEIRTAEMLPLLKNKTFPQMRKYFDEKMVFNREIDKKNKDEINSFSLNGTKDENKLISLIGRGKINSLSFETLFKLKKMLEY